MAYNEEESDLDSLMDYMIDQENEAEINNCINDDLADRVHAEEDMVNYCKHGRHQIENNQIVELNLPMDYYPHDGNWELFGKVIANNTTLRTLIHWAHMNTSPSPKQFESFWGRVSTNQSIHTLLLRNYDIDGGVEFFTIMQQFLKRLCTLELCENNINLRGAQVFGEILSSRDCNLWKLDLSGSVTSNNLWRATCSSLNSPLCTLLSLDIQDADIDDECMDVLSYAMGNNSHLVWLQILDCYDVTTRGWESLVAPLQSHTSSLKNLSIGAYNGACGVNDSLAVSLSNALASNNSKLRSLRLTTECLTSAGVGVFKHALQNPYSMLEELELGTNEVELDTVLATLSSALVNNRQLKQFHFGFDKMMLIRAESYMDGEDDLYFIDNGIIMGIITDILYNRSSIIDTYQSNHTLEKICEYDVSIVSNEVRSLLELNRNNTASVAARLKVLKAHFSDGNINPFIDMNCKVYPQAISWMAKDRQGLPLLFNFVRSMEVSFDSNVARSMSRRRLREGLAFIASHNGRGRGTHMTIPSWITSRPDRLPEKNSRAFAPNSVQAWRRKRLQLMRPFDYGNL